MTPGIQRVTMTDIAIAAGVARSTVSKALRNDPRIPASRCREVQRIAQEMGYQPHPMVSALMAQLHGQRRQADPYFISWINFWPANRRNPLAPFVNELLAGALARAKSLGYLIEVHHVEEEKISTKRLKGILAARAQWGVIIPPVPSQHMNLEFDLRDLAGVTIGTSLRTPVMHRVSSDHFQGAQLAFQKAFAKGFRRIGLVLSQTVNSRTNGKWRGAFLDQQQAMPPIDRVEPLVMEQPNATALRKWLSDFRPDAILLAEPEVGDLISSTGGADFASLQLVWLVLERHWQTICGVDHQPELLGATAVDMVVSQIHRNERGSPTAPSTVLLENRWIDSTTPNRIVQVCLESHTGKPGTHK